MDMHKVLLIIRFFHDFISKINFYNDLSILLIIYMENLSMDRNYLIYKNI